mmetsp:Transcript_69468/g.224705  ORF Transcript_69468/g.224705 Transcript_69468/m.224705 type:complete len:253 (+) Transcript_69468:107-865(+)
MLGWHISPADVHLLLRCHQPHCLAAFLAVPLLIVGHLQVPAVADLDKDGVALQLGRESGEARLDGQALGQPGLEVEAAVVLGALDQVVRHKAIRQQRGAVGAAAGSGVELPVVLCVVDAVGARAHVEALHLARRHVAHLARGHPAVLVGREARLAVPFLLRCVGGQRRRQVGALVCEVERALDRLACLGVCLVRPPLLDERGDHLAVGLPHRVVGLGELRLEHLMQLGQVVVGNHGEHVVLDVVLHVPVDEG